MVNKFISIAIILIFVFPVICLAQVETGVISGTITDTSNAVVSGAQVTVRSINTGMTRQTTTDATGFYSLPSLKPDSYDVTVEAKGFKKYSKHLQVTVGSTNDVSAQLSIGTTAETIEVVGTTEGVAVNTENSTMSQVVTSKQVAELPSLTRNPYDFIATAGNVSDDQQAGGPGTARGGGFSINGQRAASTNILLDGGENVDTFTAGVGQQVPLDSMQEYSVLTNNFNAEFGRAAGGVVNVVTKSGTNSLHGTAYEFNRLSALTANTYQNNATGIDRPHYTRNQFGFSLGGPIKKDKAFFFGSAEWIRVRSMGTAAYSITDPTWLALPQVNSNTQSFFSTYGALRPNLRTTGTIPWQTVDPNCAKDSFGIPCSQTFADLVSYNAPSDAGGGAPQNSYSIVGKVDYSFTPKDTLSVRYALENKSYFDGYVNNSPYVGYDTGENDRNQNWNLSYTHVFSPTFISTSKAIYNRLFQMQPLGSAPLTPGLFSTNAVPAITGTGVQYVMPGYVQTSTANALPFGGPQNLYEFYQDVSWTRGKHQIKFGGNFIQIRDNRIFGAYENAVQILGSNFADGINNLVTGQSYQFEGAVYPQGKLPCVKDASGSYQQTPACTLNYPMGYPSFSRNFRYNDFAAYVQDSWKVIPRLNLNYGVRWEYYGVQHNSDPSLDSNFYFGNGATIYDQIRNGQVMPAQQAGGFWKPSTKNFGPRIGFAYDIFGDGKTSLRGGYGISFERNFGNVTYNVIQNPPHYAVVSIYGEGQDVATQPIYTKNLGPFSAASGTTFLPNVTLRAPNSNIKTAYAQNYSVSIDRELFKKSVFSVEYAGSHGTHLYDIGNINTSYYGSTYLGDARAANRLNYQYGNINFRGSEAWSKYNALNLKFSSSDLARTGLTLNVNYTYAHSIDVLSSTFSDGYWGNYWLGYTDYFHPNLDSGNSDFDVRHRFVVSGVWELPWMKNSSNAVERYALGGWQISPIFTARTGNPYTIFDCTQSVSACPRWSPAGFPVSTAGHAVNTGSNVFNYLALPVDPNTSATAGLGDALQVPNQSVFCAGVNGGSPFTCSGAYPIPRNHFVGPGIWNLDVSIAKNFKLTERFNLQFRSEFYNIFNHDNLYVVGSNLDASSYDAANPFVTAGRGCKYNTCGGPNDERRFVQFALKLMF